MENSMHKLSLQLVKNPERFDCAVPKGPSDIFGHFVLFNNAFPVKIFRS